MIQENKELLFKDLSARLPYGVKVQFDNIDTSPAILEGIDNHLIICDITICELEEVKPYLLPLTNLIEEQRNYISKLLIGTRDEFSPYGKINMEGCDNLFISTVKQANSLIKYCITHHFDINGLIDKGLAIDATNLNIY